MTTKGITTKSPERHIHTSNYLTINDNGKTIKIRSGMTWITRTGKRYWCRYDTPGWYTGTYTTRTI